MAPGRGKLTRMQRRSLVLLSSGLVMAAGGCAVRLGQSAGPPGSAVPAEEIPRIGVEQAFAEVQAGRAVLVDVRSQESFQRSRAAGAILLPLDQIEQSPQVAARTLPTGKRPVLYCT